MNRYRRLPLVLGAAYLFLIAAWVFSVPAGATPDEYAHYLRALGAGRGDLVLEVPAPPLQGPIAFQRALIWQQQQARMVEIPGRLSPEVFGCRATPGRLEPCTTKAPDTDKEMEFRTWVGTYPPFVYLVPGISMRVADSTVEATYIGRFASGLLSAALVALAIAALWDRTRPWPSVAGLVVALTPMTIFVASTLSASGPEVAAGICFFACLMSLARRAPGGDGETRATPAWLWAATAFSGAVLTLSRDLGPVWIALDGLILLGWLGLPTAWRLFKGGGKAAVATLSVVAAAVAVSIVWAVKIQRRPELELADLPGEIKPSWLFFRGILEQLAGVFGPLDTVMPVWGYICWAVLAGALLILAFWAGGNRRRLVLCGAVVAGMLVTLVLDAFQRAGGFGAQGRHVLPFMVVIPLIAGEMVLGAKGRISRLASSPAVGLAFIALASFIQLVAWYTVARRYSVGVAGPMVFLKHQAWTPPVGWPLWGLVAASGAGLLLIYGLLAWRLPAAVSARDGPPPAARA